MENTHEQTFNPILMKMEMEPSKTSQMTFLKILKTDI